MNNCMALDLPAILPVADTSHTGNIELFPSVLPFGILAETHCGYRMAVVEHGTVVSVPYRACCDRWSSLENLSKAVQVLQV